MPVSDRLSALRHLVEKKGTRVKKTQTAIIIALVYAFLSLVCCQSQSCSGNRDGERAGTAFIAPDTWNDMAVYIEKEGLPVHGVVIIKNDQPVFERYFNGWDGEKPHITHHIVNSVISCCVGICVDEGLIQSADEKVAGFFPEFKSVITGIESDTHIEILSGLSDDDQVVISTGKPLTEGQQVIVLP